MDNILQEADRIIHGDRAKDYGPMDESFSRISNLWSSYLGMEVTPEDVCMMMVLLKIARARHSMTRDSLVDIGGYAAIAAVLTGADE